MMRICMATPRYVQGPGAIDRIGIETRRVGARPAVVLDAGIAEELEPGIAAAMAEAGCSATIQPHGAEVQAATLDALVQALRRNAPDVVVGVGGGKALDTAKGVAIRLDLPMVAVPTIAASDAPASRGVVLYDDEHRLVAVEQMAANPVCVIVDTAMVARAPVRFLLAGIGDAMAKKFELASARRRGLPNKHGAHPPIAASAAADACYRTLIDHSAAALAAVRAGTPGDALEAVVEANLLLSAIAFENGGLSLAHALVHGLTTYASTSGAMHGIQVALALLHQLAIEGPVDDVELGAMIAFYRSIGMPASLADHGVADRAGAIAAIAEANLASSIVSRLFPDLTRDRLVAAMEKVEIEAARLNADQGDYHGAAA